ncbi:MAG: hypothetical protein A2V70_14195 [Planctomycetes bacterium RBG_13_63_9]|nr:MAG: hypothetical protein A2V70_14195 [Planctomycetes bacterium RBG_13_63_9]
MLKMQQAARTQVESLEIRLAEIGQLGRLDVDHLQAAELNQRQVRTSLTSRSEGVAGVILALLADLENNKVDSPDVRRRMESLLQEIADLDREHLPLVGRELTAAIKTAQVALEESSDGRPSSADVGDRLAGAGKHQDQVIASLERMLAELSRWDDYRRFHREIGQLLRDQQEVARRSGELGQSTMAKDLKDLRPQERAELSVLAGQQRGLARQLDRIQQGMERTGEQLRQSDPLAAETVADALAEARRLAISGQMLSCGDHLGRNRIGQALGRQKQIIGDLEEILDILANRREHELARLVEKLSEAEAELAEIERRQADLQKRMEQDVQDADEARRGAELERLGREEAKLQEETERMARRLERLLADQAGQATQQAAGQMGRAAECAAGGAAEGACQGASEAGESLEEARRELAKRRREAQAELALEQLARLEDAVQHLRRRQEGVIAETERLDSLKRAGSELTRGQTAGLHDLAREQRFLQVETDRLAEKLIGAGAFHLVLSGAGRDMDRAAAMLQRNRTDGTTQQAENDALRRLDLVLEALKAEPPEVEPDGGGEGGGGAGGGPGGGVQMLAELKLLKLMQQEINLRTEGLQELAGAAETLTEEQRQQYALLSEEQGRVANLVLQLLQAAPQDAEGDVEELPDVGVEEEE